MEQKFGRLSKELMIKETGEKIDKSENLIITNYLGLSVAQMEDLRKKLKKAKCRYLVVKNSLVKRTLEGKKLNKISGDITGGVGIGLFERTQDPTALAKAFVDFAKANQAFVIRSAVIDGEVLDAVAIKRIAGLPPKEFLIAQALAAMKSPISGFVGALSGVLRKFVYAVNAIKEKKGK